MSTEPQPAGTTEGAISTATVGPTPDDVTQVGATDTASTTDVPQDPATAPPDAGAMIPPPADTPPADAPAEPDPNAPPPEEPTVSLVDDPQAQAVTAPATPEVPAVPATDTEPAKPAVPAQPERVLVSPGDPVLGPKVAEWVEREAARDARLSPLVDRLAFLENLYLAFPADDPIFQVPAPASDAPSPAPVTPAPAEAPAA
jgi:hypothetical protein